MSEKPSLGELISRRRKDLGMSLRDVDEATGNLVSYSTVHEMEVGARTRFGDDKLDAVADALELPRMQVRLAAGRPPKQGAPFELPDRARALSPKQRRLIINMIDALLEADEQ